MLDKLVRCFGHLTNDEVFQWGNMQDPGLQLASHPAIFKVVVNDVASLWLYGYQTNMNLLVRSPTFGGGLGQAK